MKKTIAIIEDEQSLAENYRDLFEGDNYEVWVFSNRASAEEQFATKLPDLAIVDVGLEHEPEGGFLLVQQLRQQSTTLPIIFLSNRDSDIDAVSGLRLGADDYITKDISLMKLSARVAALFRRQDALTVNPVKEDTSILNVDALTMNKDELRASWMDQPLGLTVTEFWILESLVKRPGHIKSRDQLMNAANLVVTPNTITSHIKRIRKKFQSIDANFQQIESDYSAGYRWVRG